MLDAGIVIENSGAGRALEAADGWRRIEFADYEDLAIVRDIAHQ